MTKKGKLAIVQISQTRDIDVTTVPYQEDRVIIDKGKDEPQFDVDSIFRIKTISKGPFSQLRNQLKARRAAVIWIEGKPFCEKLTASKTDLLEPITNEDRKAIVHREIAKTLAGLKGLKSWMLGAMIIALVIVIILQLLILGGVRI